MKICSRNDWNDFLIFMKFVTSINIVQFEIELFSWQNILNILVD